MATKKQQIEKLSAEVSALDQKLEASVRGEYPGLHGWRLNAPGCERFDRTTEKWVRRTQPQYIAAMRRYLDSAVQVAAGRISEAYGMGVGSAWAAKFFDAAGDERIATAQAARSISACL